MKALDLRKLNVAIQTPSIFTSKSAGNGVISVAPKFYDAELMEPYDISIVNNQTFHLTPHNFKLK